MVVMMMVVGDVKRRVSGETGAADTGGLADSHESQVVHDRPNKKEIGSRCVSCPPESIRNKHRREKESRTPTPGTSRYPNTKTAA